MGFGNQERNSVTYFTIRKGRDNQGRDKAVLAIKAPKGTPGAHQAFRNDGTPVIDKNGNEVWHKHFDYVEGRLTSMEYVEYDRGGRTDTYLELKLQYHEGVYIVTVQRGDRYWVDFAMRAPGLNPNVSVKLVPYSIKDEKTGKVNNMLIPQQAGKNVSRAWTKENNWGNDAQGNGGLPSGKKVENPVDGKMVWTFLERDRYLDEHGIAVLNKRIIEANQSNPPAPVVGGPVAADAPAELQAKPASQPAAATVVVDDNPFDGAVLEDDDLDQLPF